MNELRCCLFAFSMAVAFPACSAPTDTGPGPQPTPSPTTPGTPEPTQPTEITASWKAPTGAGFTALASATAGDEGAIAYAATAKDDTGHFTQTTLKLQRLDSAGATRGAAVELGVVASGEVSGLTIESDGSQYIACWADRVQITCATTPLGQGAATPVAPLAGTAPALAYNAGTWALAYATPTHLAVVKLTSAGVPTGSATLFDSPDPESSWTQIPLLAANKLGFVLVGGADVHVHLLDHALAPLGAPVDLGVHPWGYGAIAASDSTTAINLAEAYGSFTYFLDGATLLDKQAYAGGGKNGLRVALAVEGASYRMLSGGETNIPVNEGLVYRTLAPKTESVWAAQLPTDTRLYDHAPRSLLQLAGERFFAATQMQAGWGEEILVARVVMPAP